VNIEELVAGRLRRDAAGRAPDSLLVATLAKVAVIPQDTLWRPRRPRVGGWHPMRRPLMAVAVTLFSIGVVGALAILGGRNVVPTPVSPSSSPLPSSTPSPTSSATLAGRIGLAYGIDGDIYVADSDGTNAIRIGRGAGQAPCGGFIANRGLTSPDGRFITYRGQRTADCRDTVYLADAKGQLVASVQGWGWNIGWSPDSKHFATWLGDGTKIAVYGTDGELEATVDGALMCCGDYDAVWSPDGSDALLVKNQQSAIYELPIDGGTPQQVPGDDPRSLIPPGWHPQRVAYSPDGSRAAVVATAASVVIYEADGSQHELALDLPPDPRQYAWSLPDVMWSPTEDRVAYVALRWRPGEGDALRLVDLETGAVRTLATASGTSAIADLIGFSPDGTLILFGESDQADHVTLWEARTDATGAQKILEGTLDAGLDAGWIWRVP
jgi:hypothetical protein